jgi:alginate O-acetyltransferase complex protein AlgI
MVRLLLSMVFNSLIFLYVFLPITYFVFWRLKSKNQRYIWMTLAGYVFYSFWNYKFCALMALSTIVSYAAGLGFLRWKDPRRRKLCLTLPIIFDLTLLGVFKYTNFIVSTVNSLPKELHIPHLRSLDIILPVGISFYTFHTITYIVDSYRGVITPTRNFFEFSCYVSLFPQLVAGPIVRFRQIEQDLENINHPNKAEWLEAGWSYFVLGMIKKVLIADSIAAIINPALANYATFTTIDAWLCALGYSYQLYVDFSGYSDMAVGLGYMLGLRLPQNFNSPYRASDIADFWRRWHISLSTVLRDYLYIPLGGSRGASWKTYRNLMITMLLGGLWHGANWTFVFWGGYHGMLLCVNRIWSDQVERVPLPLRRIGTFLLVLIGWVFFRSTSFGMAGSILSRMFTWTPGVLITGAPTLFALVLLAAAIGHFGPNTWEIRHEWSPVPCAALAVLFIACLTVIYGGNQSQFLYFQF